MPADGRIVVVHAVGGQRRELEERRARIEQVLDALAGQQLAAAAVAPHCLGVAAVSSAPGGAQIGDQPQIVLAVGAKLRAGRIDARLEHRHVCSDLRSPLAQRTAALL